MKARNEVRRLEKAARALPDPGCAACRGRRRRVVSVGEAGPFPEPCAACGKVPEFVLVIEGSLPRSEEDGR